MNNKERGLLTVREAARMLGVDDRTIYRFLWEKKIKAQNAGEPDGVSRRARSGLSRTRGSSADTKRKGTCLLGKVCLRQLPKAEK